MAEVANQQTNQQPNWQGMTIKELLDKVDINSNNEPGCMMIKEKDFHSSTQTDQQSAYLGPKLWSKPMGLHEFKEDDFFVMNIDDFLAENDLQVGEDRKEISNSPPELEELSCGSPASYNSIGSHYSGSGSPPDYERKPVNFSTTAQRPSIIVSNKANPVQKVNSPVTKLSNEFLYTESKRAKLEREREEKRKRNSIDAEFAPEDLALATVPGIDFDPKERAFDPEELRPQPIIKKRQKIFVQDQEKDIKYWEKRCKNNIAARRSREARRLKENQIVLRAAYLEKENHSLKKDLDDATFLNSKLAMERDILKQKLSQYETFPAN